MLMRMLCSRRPPCQSGLPVSPVTRGCPRFGLDLSLRSVDYVAGWLDDPDGFKAGMAAIHDGAASLIDSIEALLADAERVTWPDARRRAGPRWFVRVAKPGRGRHGGDPLASGLRRVIP